MYNPYGNAAADSYSNQYQYPDQAPQSPQNLHHPQPQHATPFGHPQQQQMHMGQQQQGYQPQHQQHQPPLQQQQQQHQQQHQQSQPGFNFLNEPAAALASQFAMSGFQQSNQYLQENFGNLSISGDINYYFQVSNSYVFMKILLILFPYRQSDWSRISTKETGDTQFLPPNRDINAPDLYIPLMSFSTYILLWACFQGLKGDFHPELFGYLASQTVAFSIIDILIFKTGLYLLGCPQSSIYDIISFSSYKYVSIIVLLVLKHSIGEWLGLGYYVGVLVLIGNLAIFLMRSLRFLILPTNNTSAATNSITSRQRKIRIQFLFIYAVLIQGLIILYMSK
ncbi:Protein transport protein yif1 [Spathaspora sp. JA1]|nr:Protein transport protein yif1 [Spathaspora sp. JA1]